MLDSIRGVLKNSGPSKISIDVGGVGYRVCIGLNTYGRLPRQGEKIECFVTLVVREDSQVLYGFLTQGERDFFELLNTVSGVGPKTALAMLGNIEMGVLKQAIVAGTAGSIVKIPGVGKKTVDRLILELRDKINLESVYSESAQGVGFSQMASDAIGALVHLGYNPGEAERSVKKIIEKNQKELDLPQLISLSLRSI